jgi:phosphatidylglycerol---prolipoprotein diacylglyceryl transferase
LRPILFYVGSVPLSGYGFAIALGFAAGVTLAVREAKRQQLDSGAVLDLLFWILVSGVLGSRLAFVLLHANEYGRLCLGAGGPRSFGRALADCAAPLRLWEGGLVFYGGALAATATVALFCRRHRWRFGQLADVLAPALALGHGIGRLGCLLAGCCFGKPWAHGVSFPVGSVAYDDLARRGATTPTGTPPLHPTQLYEAAGELIILGVLLFFRRRKPFEGSVALLYALLYAVVRFVVELFRGDSARGFIGMFSTAQALSILIATAALVLFVRQHRLARA